MFNDKQKLRGLAGIVLKRCSSAEQVGTSIDNQGRTTDQAVMELDIKVVDQEILPGVTGSVPGNRDDIDRLVARKKSRNDFQVLLVQDTSRFTRAGQGHGQKLLYDLRAAGILVYFVAEDLLVDHDMAEMYVSFLFAAARHAVKMLAYNATNGTTASFLSDRSPYTKRSPMGMDRMYGEGGVDRHIIRNLPDGTQVQLDAKTNAVIRTFAKNPKKGTPQHYIKQKSETVRLIPGDPRAIATVHMIFRLRLVDGWGFYRIAKFLNDNGILSPRGSDWSKETVATMVRNPIYIGQGIRGRTTRAVYFVTNAASPQPSGVTLDHLANQRHVTRKQRPSSEWLIRPQPHLAEFLPEEIRELARASIETHLAKIADGAPVKPNRDRHLYSSFFLKDFIFSKQGGHKMTGRVGGRRGDARSYGVRRGTSIPKSGSVLGHRIRAEQLEAAVLEMTRELVLNRPGLEDAIKRLVASQINQRRNDHHHGDDLQRELARKRKQLVALVDGMTAEEDDLLTKKITAIKSEIRELERRLKDSQPQAAKTPMDVGAIAAQVAENLHQLGENLQPTDVPHIRRLLSILGTRIEADLETKVVEVEFTLPSWMGEVLSRSGAVGLEELSAYRTSHEAHPENRVILGIFRCDGSGRPICYTCRRLKMAA
jgi:hypothetical protein